jgi:hypothetical protein
VGKVTLKSSAQQLTEVAETLVSARAQLAEHPLAELWAPLLEQTETEIRAQAEADAAAARTEESK